MSAEEVPEVLTYEEAEAAGHVKRLYNQETSLNSVLFQNRDGTKTLRIYNYPVKYEDGDGNIKDKSSKLIASDIAEYKYRNESNDILTYFPDNLTKNNDVSVKYKNHSLEIKPFSVSGQRNAASASAFAEKSYAAVKSIYKNDFDIEEEAVIYENVFGTGTRIRYTPMISGVKEDIILDSNIGVNTFSFVIKTNGLMISDENGSYSLSDPKTGEKIMRIGSIEVYDSKENARFDINTYKHTAEIKTVTQNEEYVYTIIVDEAFLKDENTVYPVTVDPSFYGISDDMVEASIYKPTNSASTKYVDVGAVTAFPSVGRMLIDFPGLYNDRIYKGLTADQIVSADMNIYCYAFKNTEYIKAYTYSGPAWSDSRPSNVEYVYGIWNGFNSTAKTYRITPETKAFYNINITNAVKQWREGTYPERGLIVVNSFEDSIHDCVRIYTREDFYAQMRSAFTVTYGKVTKVYPLLDTEHHIKISQRYHGYHKALDMTTNNSAYPIQGAEIRCPINGKVIEKGKDPQAGYYIVVESSELVNQGNGFPVRFNICHMTCEAPYKKGDSVSVDDVLGYIGSSGSDWNGYHLHIAQIASDHIWYTDPDCVTRSPKSFFKAWLEE